MAGPLGTPTALPVPAYIQAFRPSSSMSASRFDEGYSEDTRSQTGSDTVMRVESHLGDGGMEPDPHYVLPDWVVQMPDTERSGEYHFDGNHFTSNAHMNPEFAYAILRSLRTSSIASIVHKLNPLLHLDPVIHLPPEITFEIFSYLTPETLLQASTLSRTWRTRVMDSPLWKLLFRLEGWNSNFAQVRTYEETERQRWAETKEKERKTRPRASEDPESDKPSSKKRLRERPLFGDGASESGIHDRLEPLTLGSARDGLPPWGEQHGVVEADNEQSLQFDDHMEGVSYNTASPLTPQTGVTSLRRKRQSENLDESATYTPPTVLDPPLQVSLVIPSPEPKINWHYLYKQKRRLEENWDAGQFSNFQLPHPNYPGEAHSECVYTIQYTGKYLVSGSRDKSVRVWDLDTQRLKYSPLMEHTASVLCLQFDDRPEQDIIVSAGSDCSIILWRFSTGKKIKLIENAHRESVLNLKFDDTYLVTCSKDKTIKVWNRKEMWPTDDTYPTTANRPGHVRIPAHIIDMQREMESQHLKAKPLTPYTLLMTLEGHGAAVNAIQILNGQIVSASGDRSIRMWDVRTGKNIKTLNGHTKGIACVQFDGRRIVSGSSDETVRIFDQATGAEVACLQGHSNLVRTVQAHFGDLPGNEEELEAEARAVDQSFFEAQRKGLVSGEMTRAQRRARNPGSRDPNAIFAYGAKLPPGGGGTKWARIVSGSYDESIIIWKKGIDGAWRKSKVLHQSEGVRAAGGRSRRPGLHGNQNQQQQAGQAPNFQALAQQAQAQAHAAQTLAQQAQALHVAAQATHGTAAAANQNTAAANTNQAGNHVANAAPNANIAHQHHHHHGGHHHHHNVQGGHNSQGTSRVFKLQFDARRIVCCSQDPTIVGWDFANNDKDIITASQFFGELA